MRELSPQESAQRQLLEVLDRLGYDFVPLTPESHRRVVARPDMRIATDLRGIFGWSLPFADKAIEADVFGLMEAARLLRRVPLGFASTARVSRVHGRLFLHSAYPTDADDSVFLGPDSVRFVDFVLSALEQRGSIDRLVDVGAGAGVGGISVAGHLRVGRVELADVNRKALGFARVNAAYAGVPVALHESNGLDKIDSGFDVAIANPPFIFEEGAPTYRQGGGMHGAELSRDWALEAARMVAPGGCVLLYTGSAIVNGVDLLRASLEHALPGLGCTIRWRELDPDIFGEELEKPAYRDVDRIAAVGGVIEKSAPKGGPSTAKP